eukprot:scaffold142505_cov40-Attheya_sp.AAC.1
MLVCFVVAAFDRRTRSARELMRQVLADRYKKANTKLKINADIHGKVDPPLVAFKFADDSELKFDSQEFVATEMLGEVFQHANNMDIDYEMNGKSIED